MTDETPPPLAAPRGLISTPAATYGASFQAHVLEQYKLYVDQTSKISDRRSSANTYLLTVNTFLVTLYGLVTASAMSQQPRADVWQFFIPFAGVLICVVWWRLLKSYSDLNTVKFRVIHELEQQLPIALFAYEWDKAEHGRGTTYTPFAYVEPIVPWIFCLLYAALMIIALK